MANFPLIRALGWAWKTIVGSAELQEIDTRFPKIPNAVDGSSHLAAAPVIITGSGGLGGSDGAQISPFLSLAAEITITAPKHLYVYGTQVIEPDALLRVLGTSGHAGNIKIESFGQIEFLSGAHGYIRPGGNLNVQGDALNDGDITWEQYSNANFQSGSALLGSQATLIWSGGAAFAGQTSGGDAIQATGTGSNSGLSAVGGGTSGAGVTATGGAGNGIGVDGAGKGSGAGVRARNQYSGSAILATRATSGGGNPSSFGSPTVQAFGYSSSDTDGAGPAFYAFQNSNYAPSIQAAKGPVQVSGASPAEGVDPKFDNVLHGANIPKAFGTLTFTSPGTVALEGGSYGVLSVAMSGSDILVTLTRAMADAYFSVPTTCSAGVLNPTGDTTGTGTCGTDCGGVGVDSRTAAGGSGGRATFHLVPLPSLAIQATGGNITAMITSGSKFGTGKIHFAVFGRQ